MELPDIFKRPEVRESIALALREDLGDVGVDVTTESLVPPEAKAEAHLVAREACIIAGVDVAKEVFLQVNPGLEVTACVSDGDEVGAMSDVLVIKGAARSIRSHRHIDGACGRPEIRTNTAKSENWRSSQTTGRAGKSGRG